MVEHPETALSRSEWIVRQLDLPPDVKLARRSLLRWFALSCGLLSPKESRTTLLDILDGLFVFWFSKNSAPTTLELQAFLKEKSGETVSDKLLLYHLKRLTDLKLVSRKNKRYLLNAPPNSHATDFAGALNYWFTNPAANSLKEIESVSQQLAEMYKQNP